MPSEPDIRRIADALAAGSVAIAGSADGATITTHVVMGAQRIELSAAALEALRAELPRVLPAPRCNLPEPDRTFRSREAAEAALRGALEAGGASQATTALRGLGGR